MKRIKFTERVQYESEGRNKGPIYEAGSVHEFDDGFADRWLRRAVAVEVDRRSPLSAVAADVEPAAPDDGLDAMTKPQLIEAAGAEGIDLRAARTNAERVAAIRVARSAKLVAAAEGDADEGEGDDGLDALDAEGLAAKVSELGITAPEGGSDDEVRATIRAHLAHVDGEQGDLLGAGAQA